jgi:hypothetical protein
MGKRKKVEPTTFRISLADLPAVRRLAEETAGTIQQAADVLLAAGIDAMMHGGRNAESWRQFVQDARAAAAAEVEAARHSIAAKQIRTTARRRLQLLRDGETAGDVAGENPPPAGLLVTELQTERPDPAATAAAVAAGFADPPATAEPERPSERAMRRSRARRKGGAS